MQRQLHVGKTPYSANGARATGHPEGKKITKNLQTKTKTLDISLTLTPNRLKYKMENYDTLKKIEEKIF